MRQGWRRRERYWGVLASNGAPGIPGTEIRTAGLLNGCHDWEDRWMSGHATVHLATTFDSRGRRVHSVWSQRRVSVVDCLTTRHSDAIANSIRDSRNGRKRPRTRIVSSIGDPGPARKSEHCRTIVSTPNRIRTGDLLRESSETRRAAVSSYAGLLGLSPRPLPLGRFAGLCGSFPGVLAASGGPRPNPRAWTGPFGDHSPGLRTRTRGDGGRDEFR